MNVRLVADREKAARLLDIAFSQDRWDEAKRGASGSPRRFASVLRRRWFWEKVRRKVVGDERHGVVYWQEYVEGNDADLRITAIGDRYAVGFWRRNRPGDFRASGSGLIDYERPVPQSAIQLALDLNRRMSLDSMAYDFVLNRDELTVLEMSYAYVDDAVWRARGYYVAEEVDSAPAFVEGHVWPQDLWVRWALERAQRELGWRLPGSASQKKDHGASGY